MLPGMSFFAGQLSSGTFIYSTPGNHSFTVPYYNTLTVEVWGGGAGGGGIGDATGDFNTDGTHYGALGGLSYITNPSLAVVGYGGGYISSTGNNGVGGQTAGYYAPNPYLFADASPGIGGIAQNGSQNVTGSNGTGGYYGCQGGSSYLGGLITTYRSTQGAGDAGNAPGGGGGGGYFANENEIKYGPYPYQPFAAGGGGGGGYAKITYSSNYRIPTGFVCTIVVGAGGAGGQYNFPGGKGADGQVKIVWS